MDDQQLLEQLRRGTNDRALVRLYRFFPPIRRMIRYYGGSRQEAEVEVPIISVCILCRLSGHHAMRQRRHYLFLLLLILLPLAAGAHIIPYELDGNPKLGTWDLFKLYLGTGYRHILPDGFDHILFILCVFFLSRDIKKVVIQASAFTVSHTITLGLGMYGFINPPASVVEPLIALSIVALALENVFSDKVKPWRLIMVFGFGLVHGMGFAAGLIEKLAENGLARNEFILPLLGFSLGVELGQLTIILLLYFFVSRPFSKKPWYRRRIVIPVSIIVAVIAAYWTVQRTFFM